MQRSALARNGLTCMRPHGGLQSVDSASVPQDRAHALQSNDLDLYSNSIEYGKSKVSPMSIGLTRSDPSQPWPFGLLNGVCLTFPPHLFLCVQLACICMNLEQMLVLDLDLTL